MIEIDGSFGEAGGQILRTSLSLSCLLKKPFRIYNIRKGRKKPGLMPQHLIAVNSAAAITNAEVKGAFAGSLELSFNPNNVKPGDYVFDIGTAGSTSLVFQTLILPLSFALSESKITIKGGTHVPFSPAFDYVKEVFLDALKPLGINVLARINRHGFYPKGGGEVEYFIKPCKRPLDSIELLNRGRLIAVQGVSAVCNLPLDIAKRQRDAFMDKTQGIKCGMQTLDVTGFGKGTYVFAKAVYEGAIAGFSSLGEIGKRAEAVGEDAAREFIEHDHSGASLDPHMADQILPYLAVANGDSAFSTSRITEHLRTNIFIISKFADASMSIGQDGIITAKGACIT